MRRQNDSIVLASPHDRVVIQPCFRDLQLNGSNVVHVGLTAYCGKRPRAIERLTELKAWPRTHWRYVVSTAITPCSIPTSDTSLYLLAYLLTRDVTVWE